MLLLCVSEMPFLPAFFPSLPCISSLLYGDQIPGRTTEATHRVQVDTEDVVKFMKAGACGLDSPCGGSHLLEKRRVLMLTGLSASYPFYLVWSPDSWSSAVHTQEGSQLFSYSFPRKSSSSSPKVCPINVL